MERPLRQAPYYRSAAATEYRKRHWIHKVKWIRPARRACLTHVCMGLAKWGLQILSDSEESAVIPHQFDDGPPACIWFTDGITFKSRCSECSVSDTYLEQGVDSSSGARVQKLVWWSWMTGTSFLASWKPIKVPIRIPFLPPLGDVQSNYFKISK